MDVKLIAVIILAAAAIAALAVLLLRADSGAARHAGGDKDAAVIAKLREVGSDISKPHDVEFFLHLPTREAAEQAARQLQSEGYSAEVEHIQGKNPWLCFASKRLVPSHAEMVGQRRKLNALAKGLGGEYDGWGTPIEP